jgi:hypothetical protein
MQPAEDWDCCDAAEFPRPPKIWRILLECKMRPNFIVIGRVILQHAMFCIATT